MAEDAAPVWPAARERLGPAGLPAAQWWLVAAVVAVAIAAALAAMVVSWWLLLVTGAALPGSVWALTHQPDGQPAVRFYGRRLRAAVRTVRRRRPWTAGAPAGAPTLRSGRTLPRPPRAQRPHPAARALAVREVDLGDGRICGLVVDADGGSGAGAATACLELRPAAADLAEAHDVARVRTGWAGMLSWLAANAGRTGLLRVGWYRQTLPQPAPEGGGLSAAVAAEAAAAAVAHRTLLAVTVDPAAGRKPPKGSQAVEVAGSRAADLLAGVVEQAGPALPGWEVLDPLLDGQRMAEVVMRHFCPDPLVPPPVDGAAAWPQAVVTRPDAYRTDGWWHRVWHVEGLPPVEADRQLLVELDQAVTDAHCVALVAEPVGWEEATRQAAAEGVDTEASAEADQDRGQRLTTGRRRRIRDADQREQLLADGHPELATSIWLGASARWRPNAAEEGRQALEEISDTVARTAVPNGVRLRAQYDAHDRGHLCLLPCGRGVGRIR